MRNPVHDLKVAWTRVKDDSLNFATVGTSIVGGTDIVQGQLNVITEPDKFKYFDEDERVINMDFERLVEEPLGGLSYALGGVTLDNTTKRFTWGVSDTIGTALKPRRPCKMFMGFRVDDQDKNIPVLYGLTDKLGETKRGRQFSFNLFDYLGYINDFELGEDAIFTDQTSDKVIKSILETTGFSSTQFSLSKGLNVIEFAWFNKGTKAGDAIRQICEAEEGHFYQDEQGLLQFDSRRKFLESPFRDTQWTVRREDILEYERARDVQIINKCTVKAKPRAVQSTTEVWRLGIAESIDAGESRTFWATFEDPVTAITNPVSGVDYEANTEADGTGSDVTSDISIVTSKFATAAKFVVTNNGASTAFMTLLRLRGTPAVVTSDIEEVFADTDSVENYGEQKLEIQNDFIDTESFAYYMARAVVRRYKDPLKRIKITIPALPHLQLKDKIVVEDMDTGVKTSYRIMKIRTRLGPGMYLQNLTLREVTDTESDNPAVVGTSVVDGDDIVWI